MPSKAPVTIEKIDKVLRQIGRRLHDRRKELGISATATAETAGLSRITLHRIEKGQASVTVAAYLSVCFALGLSLEVTNPKAAKNRIEASVKVLKKIRLTDYAQLKRLAWQIKDTHQVTPKEALELYERNWRHLDVDAMDDREKKFLKALLAAFGRERLLV